MKIQSKRAVGLEPTRFSGRGKHHSWNPILAKGYILRADFCIPCGLEFVSKGLTLSCRFWNFTMTPTSSRGAEWGLKVPPKKSRADLADMETVLDVLASLGTWLSPILSPNCLQAAINNPVFVSKNSVFISKNIPCNHREKALETPKPLIPQGF